MLPHNDPPSDDEEGFGPGQWLRSGEFCPGEDLGESFSRVAALVKDYIRADDVNLYIVKEDTKLCRIIGEATEEAETEEAGDIGPGTTIASYAGFTRDTVLVGEGTDMSNFPVGITTRQPSQFPAQILCIPIISGDKDLLACMEFIRNKKSFSQAEINLGTCICGWVGRGVRGRPEELTAQNLLYRKRLTDLRAYMQGTISLGHFISRTLESLQKRTEAKIVNLYQTDLGNIYKMYGQVKEGLFLKSYEELNLKDNKFLFEVYKRHIGIKIDEDAGAKLLNPDLIEANNHLTNLPLENYMCLPIGERSKTLVILELINTKKQKGFTTEDKDLAVDFGRLCSAAFYYDKVLRANIKTESLYEDQQNQMNKNIVCQDFIQEFFKRAPLMVTPDHFYRFDFYPRQGVDVDSLCWKIFKEVFDLNDLHDEKSLKAIYIIMAAKHFYKNTGYHNLEHAFNMCHSMFLITRNNKHIFTTTEIRALIVSTLLHDIDHPGFGNHFLQKAKTPLSQLYSCSYLENHHVYMAKQVVVKSQIFSYLNENEYKQTMRLLEKSILHTDLASYFEKKKMLGQIWESGKFNINDPFHRDLLIGITMTASDLVGQCKPFETAARLVRNLIKEQLVEAKMCQELGMPFTGIFYKVGDADLAQYQVRFNEEISLPCFDLLKKILANVSPIYIGCEKNTEIWRTVAKGYLKWDSEQGTYVESEKKIDE